MKDRQQWWRPGTPPVEGPPLELHVFRGDDWISGVGVPPLERGGITPGLGNEGRASRVPFLRARICRPASPRHQTPPNDRRDTFRTAPDTEPAHDDVFDPATDPVPVSHLALDLPEPPVRGWVTYLSGRGMEVLTDEVGRSSITRDNARLLIAEHREAEARQREVAERQERQAIEADRLRRAQRWPGVPAAMIPDGLSAASDMLAAAHDSRPRRQSPLQHALANEGSLVYHPIRGDEGES